MPSARQTLDRLINLFTKDIRSAFLAAIQDVADTVILRQVIAAIEAGDVEAAFRALGFSEAALRPITAALERSFETGGVMTGRTFPKYLRTSSGKAVFRFDVRNSRAEAWLRDRSSSLVTRLSEDARVNVRNVLRDGMERGVNPRNVALDMVGRISPNGKRVGGIIGLNQQQERWVRSARAKLQTLDADYFNMELRDKRFDNTVTRAIRDGKPLDAETIDRLVTRYKDNALRHRGEMIARTEAIQSLNRSEWEATKQAVDLGAVGDDAVTRHWDSAGDKRVRFSHSAMDHKYDKNGVGLDEPFISPSGARMMFPGDVSLGAPADEVVACRCRVRTRIDWLANLD
jgi:hypothetical protein